MQASIRKVGGSPSILAGTLVGMYPYSSVLPEDAGLKPVEQGKTGVHGSEGSGVAMM